MIQISSLPERTNRMNMGTDNFRNSSCQEVPYYNPSIIAPNSKQSSSLVEGTCDCHRNAIKSSIKFLFELNKILAFPLQIKLKSLNKTSG